MTRVADIVHFLEMFAPPALAEEWDNVGLIVGDAEREVSAVMTCLTLSGDVADEAAEKGAQLVVSHHPLLFQPVQKITAESEEGRVLLRLIEAGISVYSPHTAYDSAAAGINQQLAETLGLTGIDVLIPKSPTPDGDKLSGLRLGSGRFGELAKPLPLGRFVELVKQKLSVSHVQYVGDLSSPVNRIGIACGSAAEFMHAAREKGCDALLTGEARFHACIEARSLGMALILAGHYATERPGVERLATILADEFPALRVWASQREADPIHWA
ncbi:MAG: Nif3-like dinuclear metal center hexameric protein [Planctomycetaceae bacterium]